MVSCRGCCFTCCKGCCAISILLLIVVMILNRLYPADPPFVVTTEQQPYVEGSTVVRDYPLNFSLANSTGSELNIGAEFMLLQSMPKWVSKVATFLFGEGEYGKNQAEPHNVTFHDARQENIDFTRMGFTLVTLPNESETTNWRSQDIQKFQTEIEPAIRNLYPGVKRMVWTYSVVRNGNKLGDQPGAVNSLHLDYSQNNTARVEFHKEYPPLKFVPDASILMGETDGEEDEMRVMLGLWKPISGTVCDKPLAVIDASTFKEEQQRPMGIHINLMAFTVHNLNGAIVHDPAQRFYYYPFQTTREVLVFHQFSRDRFFANPHTSFLNPNCPTNLEPRVSVEMRVALYFGKQPPDESVAAFGSRTEL